MSGGALVLEVAESGSRVAELAGRRLPRAPLRQWPGLGGRLALRVADLLRARAFGDELTSDEDADVAAYGRALWAWLTQSFPADDVTAFLAQDEPTVLVRGLDRAREPFWELLDTGEPAAPRWFALGGSVVRVPASRPTATPRPDACDALLLTARPYLDDDVPFDVPIADVAAHLHESGHAPPAWLPGTSRAALRRIPAPAHRYFLIHADMHGTRLESADPEQLGSRLVPHLVLESEAGPQPRTVGAVLDDLPFGPPVALLLTSCESDSTDLELGDTVHGQAFRRGVDVVIASRRRLTPDEVRLFSTGFYRVLAGGGTLTGAVAEGRRTLHRAVTPAPAGPSARIGSFAWASFAVYAVDDGTQPQNAAIARPWRAAGDAAPPSAPSLFARPATGRRLAVVQVADAQEADRWRQRLTWWAGALVTRPGVIEAPAPADVSAGLEERREDGHDPSAPLIRFHDWTGLTRPETMLDRVAEGHTPLVALDRVLGAGRERRELDVVFVMCSPRLLVRSSLSPDLVLVPAPSWSRQEFDALPDPARPAASQEAEPSGADRFDRLLDVLLGRSGPPATDLLSGLRSCSSGFLRSDRHRPPDAGGVFDALDRFANLAWRVGLAWRVSAGDLVFDVYHPGIVAAVHRRIVRSADAGQTPWYDWVFRVAACAPDLVYDSSSSLALPDYRTLEDRLRRPERVFGPDAAAVSLRNYCFHAMTESAAGRVARQPWPRAWDEVGARERRRLERVQAEVDRAALARAAAGPQARKTGTPAPRAVVLELNRADNSWRPADSETAARIARSVVDLTAQSQADLASLIVNNGAYRSVGPLQVRQAMEMHIGAMLLSGAVDRDAVERVLTLFPWPEERGHFLLDLAAQLTRTGLADEAAPYLADALGLYMAMDGPHNTGHCVEILTMQAREHRRRHETSRWQSAVALASRLSDTPHWKTFTRHLDALLDEIRRGEDLPAHLRLTARLLRTPSDTLPPWLIKQRCLALMDSGRHAEAETLLATADLTEASPRTRSILDLLRVGCLLRLDRHDLALTVVDELLTRATDTVLADARYLRGDILDRRGEHDAALANDRVGSTVPGGGAYADRCALRLCLRLLRAEDFEGCVALADELLAKRVFPVSLTACVYAARALALSDAPVERLRPYVVIACWSPDLDASRSMRAALWHTGAKDLVESVWTEVLEQQTAWILGRRADVPDVVTVSAAKFLAARSMSSVEVVRDVLDAGPVDPGGFRAEVIREEVRPAVALADGLWDQGRLHEARVVFESVTAILDREFFADDVAARSELIGAAYAVATLSRRLGETERAIEWAQLALRLMPDRQEDLPDRIWKRIQDQRRLCYDLLGNAHYDQGLFKASYLFHSQALLLALGLPPRKYAQNEIASLVHGLEQPSWEVVHCLGNWGNSIGKLAGSNYTLVRYVSAVAAARLEKLDAYARDPDKAHVLSLVVSSFRAPPDDLEDDDELGHALVRIRDALAAGGRS
ncbi:hypothetical protein GTY75_13285 [Streptomyces sp. SID8381]|uniref:hypothetical protein n=1 Tax=unclassified Streptomyces TaxID=2593676 RepID=UPI0003684C62|nr:hypothetical protein [Streptomyces sp. Amel2xE9]MYX27610.1 hypothetical protein [Streptomyces sp. SID8381]